jgi:hypothetical protein
MLGTGRGIMLFGDAGAFAIEAEFTEVDGKWTYGRLRFWLAGVPIGDFDDTSDLAGSARWGHTFLAASSRRTRADLDGAPSHEVFELLYGRFVVPIHLIARPRDKPLAGFWDRDPFVLDEVGESSLRDDFGVVIIRQGDGSERLIAKRFDDERLLEARAPNGEVDRVIASYCAWVEALRELPIS